MIVDSCTFTKLLRKLSSLVWKSFFFIPLIRWMFSRCMLDANKRIRSFIFFTFVYSCTLCIAFVANQVLWLSRMEWQFTGRMFPCKINQNYYLVDASRITIPGWLMPRLRWFYQSVSFARLTLHEHRAKLPPNFSPRHFLLQNNLWLHAMTSLECSSPDDLTTEGVPFASHE